MKNKNKVDVFFNNSTSFVHGFLYFIWNIISTIIRSPLFWLLVVFGIIYYIVTYSIPPIEYCSNCHQTIK